MHLRSHVDAEISDSPHVSPNAFDVYEVNLDPDQGWCLSYVLSSCRVDVRSSLQVQGTVIRDKCIEYSVEVPTTAADVFKLALRC